MAETALNQFDSRRTKRESLCANVSVGGGRGARAGRSGDGSGGSSISFSPSFGAGIIILGAGFGIAKIGAAAVESMARQPEAAGDIRGGMILAAALIEGATFFALIVCILNNN